MKTPESFEAENADELNALRRVLDTTAPESPVTDLAMERICNAAGAARRQRRQRQFALAASVALLLGSLPFLTAPQSPPPPRSAAGHPLIEDPLLTELDLLDLQLLELTHAFAHDPLYPGLEDFL